MRTPLIVASSHLDSITSEGGAIGSVGSVFYVYCVIEVLRECE
jgi:hypothetical protein